MKAGIFCRNTGPAQSLPTGYFRGTSNKDMRPMRKTPPKSPTLLLTCNPCINTHGKHSSLKLYTRATTRPLTPLDLLERRERSLSFTLRLTRTIHWAYPQKQGREAGVKLPLITIKADKEHATGSSAGAAVPSLCIHILRRHPKMLS